MVEGREGGREGGEEGEKEREEADKVSSPLPARTGRGPQNWTVTAKSLLPLSRLPQQQQQQQQSMSTTHSR